MSGKGPVHKIEETIEGFGFNPVWLFISVGLGMIIFIVLAVGIPFERTFGIIVLLSPIWLPYVLFRIFYDTWLYYVRKKFDLNQGRVTLEIKIPQEILKSPLAMELVLTQLYQTASPDNHLQTYIDGKKPPTYGLEIVSDGGRVRFFINTPRKKFKNMFEAQLYAQYPGIEVVELPIDYTAKIPWDPEKYQYFSLHFGLKEADPLPIKTYVDFGLADDPKEEFKIDPITPTIEMLGSITPREQIWIQILITAHRKLNFKTGSLRKKPDWKDDVKKMIAEIAQRKNGDTEKATLERLTPGEKDTIVALERSLSKYPFETAIRAMYIAETDAYNPGERIGAIISAWRAYDDITRNQIAIKWRTDYDWNWFQDRHGHKKMHHKKRELNEYKLREYEPQTVDRDTPKIMTTEELATIFHIPGQVILTPTLDRIPSTRAQAPANLPFGTGV